MSLGPAAGKLPTCCTPHYCREPADAAAAPDPLSHTHCTIAFQVACALRQLQPDSVAHIELQYSPQEPRFSRVAGGVLDVCQGDAGQVVLDAHPFRECAAEPPLCSDTVPCLCSRRRLQHGRVGRLRQLPWLAATWWAMAEEGPCMLPCMLRSPER